MDKSSSSTSYSLDGIHSTRIDIVVILQVPQCRRKQLWWSLEMAEGWSRRSFASRIEKWRRTRALEYQYGGKYYSSSFNEILKIIIYNKYGRRHNFTCHNNNTNSLLGVVGSRPEWSWYSSILLPFEFWLMGTLIEFAKWNIIIITTIILEQFTGSWRIRRIVHCQSVIALWYTYKKRLYWWWPEGDLNDQ